MQMLHLKTVHCFQHVKQINYTFIDQASIIHMSMPIDNLIEYSNNYSDRSGSLWQFQRDKTVPPKYLQFLEISRNALN